MANELLGIHHVTVLASDPQRNVDFYVRIMGMRLVKMTVNFDAPDIYHLYYGDETGRPGTILTFFPFPDAARGSAGTGQAVSVSFSVHGGSLEYWIDRLASHAIHFDGPVQRFGQELITFEDPDGLLLELVAPHPDNASTAVGNDRNSPGHSIQGFYGITLCEEEYGGTARTLTETMGFRLAGSSGNRSRFMAGREPNEARVDLLVSPDANHGRMSAGSIHHIAWRTPSGQEQAGWRTKIAGAGLDVTPIIDRQYFTSIYFHEPGGVLFEIATDPPGFTVDEPLEKLGTSLKLPSWLEQHRKRLEQVLPSLKLPVASKG